MTEITITSITILTDPIYFEDDLSSSVDISDRLYLIVFFLSTVSSDLSCSIFWRSSSFVSGVYVMLSQEQVHLGSVAERSVWIILAVFDVVMVVSIAVSFDPGITDVHATKRLIFYTLYYIVFSKLVMWYPLSDTL